MQAAAADPRPSRETVEPVLQLEKELAEARKAAIETLLAERGHIDAALARIGYEHETAPGRKATADRKCSVCGETGHDGRRHKSRKTDVAA